MKLLPLAATALALACTGTIGTAPGLIGQGLDGGPGDGGPTPDAGPGWDAGWPDAGACPPAFGGNGRTLGSGLSYPRHLAAASDRLFVTEVGVYNKPLGKLDAVFFDGGVTPLLTGLDSPDAVATDGTSVFWVDRQNGLQKMPAGGGTVTQLDTRVNGALEGLTALAWDGTSLVYATGSRYLELVKSNGTSSNLFTGDAGTVVSSVAVEGTTAYFLVQGVAPGLYSVSLSGSPRPTQVLPEPAQGSSLALTATDFIWATGAGGSGKVQSHPRAGGATVDLASGLNGPGSVVQAGAETYFQDSTTGSAASPWFFQVKPTCLSGPIPVGPIGQAVGDAVLSSNGSTLYFTSLGGTGQGYVGALP